MVHQLGSITVSAEAGLLPGVEAFARQAASLAGLQDAGPFARVVAHVCGVAMERGYGGDASGTVEVELARHAGRLVCAVTDRGLPFDYRPLRSSSA